MNRKCSESIIIPVLPLRNVVVYPHMVISLFLGREKSIKGLEIAMNQSKKIMLVTQRDPIINEPRIQDMYTIGTFSSILKILNLSEGIKKIIVQGLKRARINEFSDNNKESFLAKIEYLMSPKMNKRKQELLRRATINQFEKYIQLSKIIPLQFLNVLEKIHDPAHIGDLVAAILPLELSEKQSLLEIENVNERLECLITQLKIAIEFLQLNERIDKRVKTQLEKNQREYYINEQIKALKKELDEIIDESPEEFHEDYDDNDENEFFTKKILEAKMPPEAHKKTESELQRLKMMSPMSSEATVIRNYLEWMFQVPWYARTKIKKNLHKAKETLDNDHFGLENVKERILEYLAVQNRINKNNRGPILCLVGPPGVGKTSLGESISKATGRKYVRMALGGIRDEGEIRGHRRTYIGSMPGKLMQKIAKVGVKNPLFLLDEIDKMSSDFRGDPAAALLEVLDPEQNYAFNDHYLEVDYDLSDVMFIATSNSMNIPHPLLDRMEVIRISGYTEDEKLNIANRYLLPKQIKRNALKSNEIILDEEAILDIIRFYTCEAGVRNLERQLSKLCRKVVKILLMDPTIKSIEIKQDNLEDYLGIQGFQYGKALSKNSIGQVSGLAWTENGGDILRIESSCLPGKGKCFYTGSLGKVMRESIQAAVTVVRTLADKLRIKHNFHETNDIHIHVPDGATPKDGPSAGISMCTVLVSCLTKNPVRADVAMTGEITLTGQVLPIGGLKEKLLAAHRAGIQTIVIPDGNQRELEKIPANIRMNLNIYPVKQVEEVLNIALQNNPICP
ncbi:MAG: endopeptidase La [Candidatus Dasytiphilus stammeri]